MDNLKYRLLAIARLTNNAEYVWVGEDPQGLSFVDSSIPTPSQKEIDDMIKVIKMEEESKKIEMENKKELLLKRLGITEDEAKLLLS